MTIGHAKAFIQRGMQESKLRDQLNRSGNSTALRTVLEKEGLAFSIHDFEEAFHNLLTQCHEQEQADQLREFKMWWALTVAMSTASISEHSAS